jgi:hypothetical protein
MIGPRAMRGRLVKCVLWSLPLLATVAAVFSFGLIEGRAATAEIPAQELQAQVKAAIPDATGEITSAQDAGSEYGQQLVITPAREDVKQSEEDAFAYGDVAWRAGMLAASLSTEVPGLAGYRLSAPADMQVSVPSAALGVLQGSLPPAGAGAKLVDLGSVSEKEALAQMASNLATLEAALPPPVVTSTGVSIVPVDAERGRFALSVTVGTEASATLLEHAGDVMVGLQTGLVGDVRANIEGLAITVLEGGRPLAASWIAVRAMAGTTMLAPGLELPAVQSVDADFRNLTGGPEVAAAGLGDVTQLPSLPTSARIRLSSARRSTYSTKGRISTHEYSSPLPPRFMPHPRPQLPVEACAVVRISFTAPARRVKVGVQKLGPEGDHSVGVAQPIAHRASEDGLVWKARVPGWRRLRGATTLRVTAAYPGGYGQYVAGLMPVEGRHCSLGTKTR